MEAVLFLLHSTPASPNAQRAFETARQLVARGDRVSICLLQDAVLAGLANERAADSPGARALQAGIALYVMGDDLALRGFDAHKLTAGVSVTDYAQLVDMFETHTRVIGAL